MLLVGFESSPSNLSATGSYSYDQDLGWIQFMTDELVKTQFLQAVMAFKLDQDVSPGQIIELELSLTWNSLPYGKTGGRSYQTTEKHTVKPNSNIKIVLIHLHDRLLSSQASWSYHI